MMAEFALFISKQIKKKKTKNNRTNPKQRKNPTKMCPSPALPHIPIPNLLLVTSEKLFKML